LGKGEKRIKCKTAVNAFCDFNCGEEFKFPPPQTNVSKKYLPFLIPLGLLLQPVDLAFNILINYRFKVYYFTL